MARANHKRSKQEVQEDIESQTKWCSLCDKRMSFEFFYNLKSSPDGKYSSCKKCAYKHEKKWVAANREQSAMIKRRRDLRKKYGITLEDYTRMYVKQKGRCLICDTKHEEGKLVVDHCHATGTVRALLCSKCNKGLGLFHDDVDLMQEAAKYITRYKGE